MAAAAAQAEKTMTTIAIRKSAPVFVHPSNGASGEAYAGGFYDLCNLDQNLALVMKVVHFYKAAAADEEGGRRPARVLKDALAQVLNHFWPFTGSLALTPDGKFVVRCTGAGVPFVDAVADCDMDAVGDISDADPAVLASLVHTDPAAKNLLEMPLLAIQVTSFRCGGFVVGVATSHCLADGISAVHYHRAWAEMARGLPLGTPPFLDRSMLRARRPPKVDFPHPEYAEIEDISGTTALFRREAMSYRHFTFDAAALARLKRSVLEEDPAAAAGCTSFSVLVALVWRARSRALGFVPAQKTKLLFAVDVRRRVDPPLPDGYLGNGIAFACCLCEAGELAARPLSAAATMVRDAARGITGDYVRSAIDYFEVTGARPSLTATLTVTAWTRLGLEKVDFGWGHQVQMGGVELPGKEVAVLLPPRPETEGGVVLSIGLPVSAMDTFQKLITEYGG